VEGDLASGADHHRSMPWVVAWRSRRGWTGRGMKWPTKEKAEQIAKDLNFDFNPYVFYKAVEVNDDYDEFAADASIMDKAMPTQRHQKVDDKDSADQNEKAIPDSHRNRRDGWTFEKPPTHRVNNADANTNQQDHQKLVNKSVTRSKVNRRQRYDK
jgi:hypothetical protein